MSDAWLIPDSAPVGTRQVVLVVPAGDDWEALVRGALALLLRAENFQQAGAITPQEAVAYFAEPLLDTFRSWG